MTEEGKEGVCTSKQLMAHKAMAGAMQHMTHYVPALQHTFSQDMIFASKQSMHASVTMLAAQLVCCVNFKPMQQKPNQLSSCPCIA